MNAGRGFKSRIEIENVIDYLPITSSHAAVANSMNQSMPCHLGSS